MDLIFLSVLFWISNKAESTFLDEDIVFSASLRTSSATTANPRPASPARAASMAALNIKLNLQIGIITNQCLLYNKNLMVSNQVD